MGYCQVRRGFSFALIVLFFSISKLALSVDSTTPLPNGSAKLDPPAYENDSKIKDVSIYTAPDNMQTKVYFGLLHEGKAISDATFQEEIQIEVNNAAAGLPSTGLSLAQDGTALYKGRAIRLIFYWYQYNAQGKVLKSGAFESSLQNSIYARWRGNLEESIRRANWAPPGYSDLAVPAVKPITRPKPTPGHNSVPTADYISGMSRLKQIISMIDPVDSVLTKKLRALAGQSRVVPLKRVNLEGGEEPTVIYQMIGYTQNGILVAEDSFKKLADEHQSDAMLYALLTGTLPDSPNRRAKAWKFHLSILASIDGDKIDPAKYEEGKRMFSMSPRTEALFALLADFDSYRNTVAERYGVDGPEAKRIHSELNSLSEYLSIDAFRLLYEDYERIFGKGPRYLPNSPESNPVTRYKFRIWNLLGNAFSADATDESMEKKAAAIEKALDLIQSGKITSADLDKLLVKEAPPAPPATNGPQINPNPRPAGR